MKEEENSLLWSGKLYKKPESQPESVSAAR